MPNGKKIILNIVTPCFNSVETVDETIFSVVSQAGDFHIRYHVQDGGSTDGTIERLKYWENVLESHQFPILCSSVDFSWTSEPDEGMYDAINKGFSSLDIATDCPMAWVNADDTYTQHTFATVAGVFEQNPEINWLGGMISMMGHKGWLQKMHNPTYYPQELIRQGCCDGSNWPHLQQNGMFWRHALWEKSGPLDEGLKFAGDWKLWQRFARHSYFVHLAAVFGTFRIHHGQLSLNEGYQKEQERILPMEKRIQRCRSFFADNLLPPRTKCIIPSNPWKGPIEMHVQDRVPENQSVEYYKRHFRLWKNRLPTAVRNVLGNIRRILINARTKLFNGRHPQ